MLFDTHAHIVDSRFGTEQEAVIQRAEANGVNWILNAGADMHSSYLGVGLAEKYDQVYAAVGIHPHDAKDAKSADYEQLAVWATHPKVVAIGEIGLDYHYDFSPREIQQAVFSHQLQMARQTGKPVIIHDREAHADVLATIKEAGAGLTGVFHCFSGSWEMAQEVLSMGFYISIAGPVTFTNAHKLLDIAQLVPLDRLLIETDSPYLTPHPHRGKRNEPAYVRLVGEKIAHIRGIELAQLAQATTANAKRLFAIEI